ncbi:MAG: hypothetical protein QXL18_05585 [Candidatus Woesearchaeota archaeon]
MKERIYNTHQAIQNSWEKRVLGEEEGINRRFEKLKEEINEVFQAYSKPVEEMSFDEKKSLAMELTDMIIIGLGCISNLGFDFERLFDEKMFINWIKYNPYLIDEIQKKEGLTRQQAIVRAKQIWNERNQS